MDKKTRIASYLAQNLKASQVAAIVGVTQAYVSQLIKEANEKPDEGFGLILKEQRAKEAEAFSEDKSLTSKYLSIEHRLLEAMENQMPYAELPALTNALRVVSERQEKRLQRIQAPSGPTITNVIQLTIPAHAVPEHVINAQREVVAIGSKQLAPLSSDGVKNLFDQIQARRERTAQAIEAPAMKDIPADF